MPKNIWAAILGPFGPLSIVNRGYLNAKMGRELVLQYITYLCWKGEYEMIDMVDCNKVK